MESIMCNTLKKEKMLFLPNSLFFPLQIKSIFMQIPESCRNLIGRGENKTRNRDFCGKQAEVRIQNDNKEGEKQ